MIFRTIDFEKGTANGRLFYCVLDLRGLCVILRAEILAKGLE